MKMKNKKYKFWLIKTKSAIIIDIKNGCKVFIVNFCIKGDKVLKKIRLREKYFVKNKFCVMLE